VRCGACSVFRRSRPCVAFCVLLAVLVSVQLCAIHVGLMLSAVLLACGCCKLRLEAPLPVRAGQRTPAPSLAISKCSSWTATTATWASATCCGSRPTPRRRCRDRPQETRRTRETTQHNNIRPISRNRGTHRGRYSHNTHNSLCRAMRSSHSSCSSGERCKGRCLCPRYRHNQTRSGLSTHCPSWPTCASIGSGTSRASNKCSGPGLRANRREDMHTCRTFHAVRNNRRFLYSLGYLCALTCTNCNTPPRPRSESAMDSIAKQAHLPTSLQYSAGDAVHCCICSISIAG
jgi:hypothetical protein